MSVQPISLYLDLEPGEAPDLEVVSRAAIAWAEAIKEIAFLLDPSIEVRIELESGTEGSLSLNGLVRALRGSKDIKADLRTVVIAVLVWFALHSLDYAFEAVLDHLRGVDDPAIAQLSDEQLNKIADRVAARLSPQMAQEQKKQIFSELDRDMSIRGAGVSVTPARRPGYLVPRPEFARRANVSSELLIEGERSRTQRIRAQLVSPVLKAVPRSWRFQVAGLPEFGAAMRDRAFLEAIAEKRIRFLLQSGVEMEFDMEVKERNEGGVWVPVERVINKVYRPRVDRRELPLSH